MQTMCKLIANDPTRPARGAAWKDEATSPFLTLDQQIEEDKKYGRLVPKNKRLSYVLMNHDKELTRGEARRAINAAIMGWQLGTDVDFYEISIGGEPDITIQFLDSTDDQLFADEPNVLAYMYYPIASEDVRGLMVINSDYPWTENGEPKSGRWIMEMTGKPVQFPDQMYETWSLRKVVRHELGHGVYGLPHTANVGNTMYFSYNGMTEFNTTEDDKRGQAKMGEPTRSTRWLKVMRAWLRRKYG